MAEKREGFGVDAKAVEAAQAAPVVYETPDYRVIIGQLSGPAETPIELRTRYIIQHKKHGVIYGSREGFGHAVAVALVAQAELQNAARIAEEQKARNYESVNVPADDHQQTSGGAVPRFTN